MVLTLSLATGLKLVTQPASTSSVIVHTTHVPSSGIVSEDHSRESHQHEQTNAERHLESSRVEHGAPTVLITARWLCLRYSSSLAVLSNNAECCFPEAHLSLSRLRLLGSSRNAF